MGLVSYLFPQCEKMVFDSSTYSLSSGNQTLQKEDLLEVFL